MGTKFKNYKKQILGGFLLFGWLMTPTLLILAMEFWNYGYHEFWKYAWTKDQSAEFRMASTVLAALAAVSLLLLLALSFFILEEMCCQRTDKRKSGGQGSHRTGSSGCFAERLAVGGDVCRRSLLSGGRPVFFRYGFDKCKIHCSGCVENRGSQSCLLYRNSFAIPENPSENHKADQCNLERNENLQRENTLGNTASE